MASFTINALQVNFESVLSMDNIELVKMFRSLEESGLRGFLGVSGSVFEGSLTDFFANASFITGPVGPGDGPACRAPAMGDRSRAADVKKPWASRVVSHGLGPGANAPRPRGVPMSHVCHKHHPGQCMMGSGGCYHYKEPVHVSKDCPRRRQSTGRFYVMQAEAVDPDTTLLTGILLYNFRRFRDFGMMVFGCFKYCMLSRALPGDSMP
ncbi:hypothetical protein F511_37935 [Dorcoceras hygrometricum]|uniref:Uncharacterized protein n=1 Tax=Dorcoceras hygrometricum TaxID=472368 RepID=A0A2Z7C395_9LAMI|nr:hypothetical protein F511_37935 [Dorcoceras hygrometricum]